MHIRTLIILCTLGCCITLAGLAWGGTYLSKTEALKRAFPQADRVETVNLFLTPEEVTEISRLAGAPLTSPLHTFYVGKKGTQTLGYAAIEAATVRTMPETVMIVLTPDARVSFVEILAFFEPEEYLPSRRWLQQFVGAQLSDALRIGGSVQAMTGATLSAQAVTRQVRLTTALAQRIQERH